MDSKRTCCLLSNNALLYCYCQIHIHVNRTIKVERSGCGKWPDVLGITAGEVDVYSWSSHLFCRFGRSICVIRTILYNVGHRYIVDKGKFRTFRNGSGGYQEI